MTSARLWPVVLALVLALGTLAVPATAAPSQDGGAVWTRDDPVVNPSKQPLVRDLGAGGTYTWSTPSVTGPLTVTNDWAHNWHWVGKVSWTEPPAQFVEGVSQTLAITSDVTTKGASGGIDFNANWGWANGFGGSIPREQTAVCSGACGPTATTTVAITMPVGQTYDKDHPENNPTLWVTVDGQTIFYARYSRSAPPPPPAVVVNPTPPPPDATVLDFCRIPAPDPNVSPPQPDPNLDGTAEMRVAALQDTPAPTLVELGPWKDLMTFRPRSSVEQRLNNTVPNSSIQRIEDACGPEINIDFYPIKVTRLPTVNGRVLTAEEFLKYIRLNINTMVDTDIGEYFPYNDDAAQRQLWESDNPLSAAGTWKLKLGGVVPLVGGAFNPDDGSVVVSDFKSDSWTFTTVRTPLDQGHPVSGNRQFGFTPEADGSYTFYTRGADRATQLMDTAMQGSVFAGGNGIWSSYQNRVTQFVNDNGGMATGGQIISQRYPWGLVKPMYFSPQ